MQPSIRDVIEAWALERDNKIPWDPTDKSVRLGHFMDLIVSLEHYGYSKEDITSNLTQSVLLEIIISPVSKKKQQLKEINSRDWRHAVLSHWPIETVQSKPEDFKIKKQHFEFKPYTPKSEPEVEHVPYEEPPVERIGRPLDRDRLKHVTPDHASFEWDLDFGEEK